MDEVRFELDCDTVSPHFHNELEILYVLSGDLTVIYGGSNFALSAEDFIVFNPYEHHRLDKVQGTHTLSAYIPGIILQQAGLGRVLCCSAIQYEKEDYLRLIKTRLALLYKSYSDAGEQRVPQVLSQLFGLLAVLRGQFERKENENEGNDPDAEKIQAILTYVGQHFAEEISLQSAADELYLSRSHLSRMFQKQIDVSFSDYVRDIRLNKARYLLCSTKNSVTDIALNCGFSNPNTFILNFTQAFGVTPGAYRKRAMRSGAWKEPEEAKEDVSYMRLLKYAAYEEISQPLTKNMESLDRIRVDVRRELGDVNLHHNEVISVGWADSLLHENVRVAVRKASREIGFRYILFQGILSDTLSVYHEQEDGQVWLNFTYVDMILDFILECGARPWLEFGFTPLKMVAGEKEMYGAACINIPDDLDKWRAVVGQMMEHLIDRYGVEELRRWKFLPPRAVLVIMKILLVSRFREYYLVTVETIRKYLPDAYLVGSHFDTGMMKIDQCAFLKQHLEFCKANNCVPDEISLQCFHSDYSGHMADDTLERIVAKAEQRMGEPVPVSADPNLLKKETAMVRSILDELGMGKTPISLCAWNPTIWQGELGNDTCFQAAFLMKNMLENAGKLSGYSYTLTDITERSVLNSSMYHGGYGLITYQGIPKAGYLAYGLLNQMGKTLIGRGGGYMITKTPGKKEIQIALYHYCHFNMKTHMTEDVPEDEQRTVDRYYGFETKGLRGFRFHLVGIDAGIYEKETYAINREFGSSYDVWMSMGAPPMLTQKQQKYLEKLSEPRYQYESVRVSEEGELLVSAVLDEHEVRLIKIKKR